MRDQYTTIPATGMKAQIAGVSLPAAEDPRVRYLLFDPIRRRTRSTDITEEVETCACVGKECQQVPMGSSRQAVAVVAAQPGGGGIRQDPKYEGEKALHAGIFFRVSDEYFRPLGISNRWSNAISFGCVVVG